MLRTIFSSETLLIEWSSNIGPCAIQMEMLEPEIHTLRNRRFETLVNVVVDSFMHLKIWFAHIVSHKQTVNH